MPISPLVANRADSAIIPDADIPSSQRSHGRQDRETAFHVWAGPAKRNLSKTASLTGYALSTVHRWCHQEDWESRAVDLWENRKASAAQTVDAIVQQMILASQIPSLVALQEMVNDPAHKRRDVVAFGLLALGGRPLPKAPTITATRQLGDGSTISVKMSDLSALSPTELAQYARTGILPSGAADTEDTTPIPIDDSE